MTSPAFNLQRDYIVEILNNGYVVTLGCGYNNSFTASMYKTNKYVCKTIEEVETTLVNHVRETVTFLKDNK